jgi:two-component system OmpR family sensor kinase
VISRQWAWLFGLATLPAWLGLLAWVGMASLGWLPDSVVYLRISLGYLLLLTGLAFTLLLFGFLSLVYLSSRRARTLQEQVQSEAALRRQQFLMRLDHELKNPLTSLQVDAAILEAACATTETGLESEHHQAARRLQEQVSRLNDLVTQLRKLGELENRPIELEQVDLDEQLRDLLAEFQASPEGLQREISLNLPDVPWPLPKIEGDGDLLYIALRNVLDNAVKFTRPGDSIQVRAFEDANQVIIEVADTGPGIPPEEQEHIWEELFRGRSARGTPGSGLGLALVKAVIERHAGQADLRSRLGQGTVVTFRLPLRLT